ncbi:MAG: hypothetical protein ACLSCX_09015 [Oscillospiraceae bacterium]
MKEVKFYDQRELYIFHPSVYRNGADQGHDRYPPLRKVSHVGAIQQELAESGVSRAQFISINFEDMSYSHLQTAQALHDEITKRAKEITARSTSFR